MEELKIKIDDVRNIKTIDIKLPLSPGLYAITGKNGSGKSTLMATIANLFYYQLLNSFFVNCANDKSQISYRFKNIEQNFTYDDNRKAWRMHGRKIYMHGFYEGSLIHGNRFRDTNRRALLNAANVKKGELIEAGQEIKDNLGLILHDNREKYQNLFKVRSDRAHQIFKFRGSPYFLVEGDKLISQLSLSTGENLLLSLLHSLYNQLSSRKGKSDNYFVLLDEVELALHPSALIRLVKYLKKISKENKMAIYFSTHSTDLIRNIDPNNIFFLNKHLDRSIEVINPCYPAYATRNIYMHDGYDYLILVEDLLTKKMIDWVLKKEGLLSSKLVHILPCGGWHSVIALHQEIMTSNFLGAGKKAFTVLDGDVEANYKKEYIDKGLHHNLNVAFLPIKSAEKLLRSKLIDNVDHQFFRHFNDSFFHKKSLDEIVGEYVSDNPNDRKGKALIKKIRTELETIDSSFDEIATKMMEYIVEHENMTPLTRRVRGIFT